MSQTTTVTTETALFARSLIARLGTEQSMTIGNAETGEVSPVPPHIAALVHQVLVSLAAGHQVAITEDLTELSPNEAAHVLNVSRTFVLKLMDEGHLPYRTVGSHRRIPYADLIAYRDAQKVRGRAAMDELYKLDQELGLHDLADPAAEAPTPGTGPR